MVSGSASPVGRFQKRILACSDLRRTWLQILPFSLATRSAVAIVLLPVLATILRLVLSLQGQRTLSDQEILFFILSPMGLATLVLLGGFWIGIAFIEQAGIMMIGFGAAEGKRVTWLRALRFVVAKLHVILLLGCHLLARALLLAAPFLAASGGVFWLFLHEHDINYYLENRPPEFLLAAGIIGLLLAVLAILLIRRITSWLFALPSVLFSGLAPPAAIRRAIADSRGHLGELCGWMLAWIVCGAVASAVVTWAIGIFGKMLLSLTFASLYLTAVTIAGIGFATLLANISIALFAAALFALVFTRLYRAYSGPGKLDDRWASPNSLVDRNGKRIPGKGLLAAGAAAFILATVAATLIASNLGTEEFPLIIAHRGATSKAPENTMAAIRGAIADRADFVEIDVQETADDEVVVFHDSDFMKVAANPLKIWEATRAELEEIDIGSFFDPMFAGARVPTLDEVLRECKGRIKVVIELKYYGHDKNLEQRVVNIVERHAMAREVAIMSLKYDKIAKAKALRPTWNYGLLTSVQLGDISKFDVDFLAVNASGASRGFIRTARKAAHDLYAWTVNDPLAMSSMMGRGVDGIITDKPALARRVRKIRADMNPFERLLITVGTEVGVLSLPDAIPNEEDA